MLRWISCPASSWLRAAWTAPRVSEPGSTARSNTFLDPSLSQTISDVTPGALPLTIASLALTATASAISPLLTAIRRMPAGSSITIDLLRPRVKREADEGSGAMGLGFCVAAGVATGGAAACKVVADGALKGVSAPVVGQNAGGVICPKLMT